MNDWLAVYLAGVVATAIVRLVRFAGPGFDPVENLIDTFTWPVVFMIGGVSATCGPDGDE